MGLFDRFKDDRLDENEIKKNDIHSLLALMDGPPEIRRKSVNALVDIGKPATPHLINSIDHPNPRVREDIIETLGRIKDPEALEVIISTLDDPGWEVRRNAVKALGLIKGEEAVNPLIQALDDENKKVRTNALASLGKIGDIRAQKFFIESFKGKNKQTHKIVTKALIKIGPSSVDSLIGFLKDSEDEVRGRAAEALGEIGDIKATPFLVELLKDDISDVRIKAADALGQLKDSAAIGPLVEARNDDDYEVAEVAIWALRDMGDEALQPLLRILKEDNVDARKMAAQTLGHMGHKKAIKPLIEALNDESEYVRRGASWGLGKIKADEGMEPLIEALDDDEWWVRMDAATALGNFKEKKAVEALGMLLDKEKEMIVAERVINSLREIGDKDAIGPLSRFLFSKFDRLKWRTLMALDEIGWEPSNDLETVYHLIIKKKWHDVGEYGELAVEPLHLALDNVDFHDKANIISILGNIGNPKSVNHILRYLGTGQGVYIEAMAALEKIDDVLVIDGLIGVAEREGFDAENAKKVLEKKGFTMEEK